MDSPSHIDDLFVHVCFVNVLRDRQHIAGVALDGMAQLLHSKTIL